MKEMLLRVGDGRGFVVEERRGLCLYPKRLVVTAAHCLPVIPQAPGFRRDWGETLRDLLGPPERNRPKVWAECLFADPIADIAVLGSPDDQALYEQAEAYEALVGSVVPIKIGGPFPWETPTPITLISLDGRSITGKAQHLGGRLWIDETSEPIVGGMSGSPILDQDGAAIGIVSQSSGGPDLEQHQKGMSPRLLAHLPGWLLVNLGAAKALDAERRFALAAVAPAFCKYDL
jgi:hypothetical protein